MTKTTVNKPSRWSRLGWGVLLAISSLLALNGAAWFFFGPAQATASLEAFPGAYPSIAPQMMQNARQVAVWFLAFGLLAFWTGLEGFRRGSRRAWYGMWIQTAVLVAIGLIYKDGFGIFLLGLSPVALIGQLLAGRDLAAESAGAVEAD